MRSSGRVLLTRREREIVDRILCGCTANEVARELGVSFHTVRTHLRNLYGRLGVSNRLELMRWSQGTFDSQPETGDAS